MTYCSTDATPTLDGDRGVLETSGSLIDSFDPDFAVVTP